VTRCKQRLASRGGRRCRRAALLDWDYCRQHMNFLLADSATKVIARGFNAMFGGGLPVMVPVEILEEGPEPQAVLKRVAEVFARE
jgi:hypothetical protein